MPPRRVSRGRSARAQHNQLQQLRESERIAREIEAEEAEEAIRDKVIGLLESVTDEESLKWAIEDAQSQNLTPAELASLRKVAKPELILRKFDIRYGHGNCACNMPCFVEFPKLGEGEGPTVTPPFDEKKYILVSLLVPSLAKTTSNGVVKPVGSAGASGVGADVEEDDQDAEGTDDMEYIESAESSYARKSEFIFMLCTRNAFKKYSTLYQVTHVRVRAIVPNQVAVILGLLRMRLQETKPNFPERELVPDYNSEFLVFSLDLGLLCLLP